MFYQISTYHYNHIKSIGQIAPSPHVSRHGQRSRVNSGQITKYKKNNKLNKHAATSKGNSLEQVKAVLPRRRIKRVPIPSFPIQNILDLAFTIFQIQFRINWNHFPAKALYLSCPVYVFISLHILRSAHTVLNTPRYP